MNENTDSVIDRVVASLQAAGYQKVVCLQQTAAARAVQNRDAVQHQLQEQTDRQTVVVDGTGADQGRGALYRAVASLVQSDSNDGDGTVARLFDYLTMALDMESTSLEATDRVEVLVETVVRLVEQLSDRRPILFVVLAPQQLPRFERRALVAVMRHFLSLPLADIQEESDPDPPVGFVWGDSAGDWSQLETEQVDSGDEEIETVRRFLSDDRVVRRVADTTGGDPRRLDALLGALPETVSQLWSRRIAELSPQSRRVAEFLAVAGEPLEVGFIDRVVDGPTVSLLQPLCDGGVARRRMVDGTVRVELAGRDIREGIEETIDDDTRRQLQLVLARTALGTGERDDAFVARHALEGGDEELGLRVGLPAVHQMLRRGQWEGAGELLDMLAEAAGDDNDQRRTILELSLQVAEGQGQWHRALTVADQLRDLDEDPERAGGHDRRIAGYFAKLGSQDAARQHFGKALELLDADQDEERARTLIGFAELHYQCGEYEEAQDRVVNAIEILASDQELGADVCGQLRLKCDNVLGKVALFRGELEDARRYFERNAAGARRLGRQLDELHAEVNLGVVAVQQKRYDEARRRLTRGIERTDLPGAGTRLICWLNLGIVHQRRGDFDDAFDCYRRALQEARRCRDQVSVDIAIHNLATLYQDVGAYDRAYRLIGELEDDADGESSGRFGAPWVAMVQGEILLEQGETARAVEALERARARMQDDRLYATQLRLRTARAHLGLGEVQKARDIVESLDSQRVADTEQQSLYDYVVALLDGRTGSSPDEQRWRRIIEDLEQAGSYYDAMGARLHLADQLIDDDARNRETATLVVERGIEDLRQRARAVPESLEDDFYAIPVHRRLIELFDQLREQGLPDDLKQYQREDDDSTSDGEDRENDRSPVSENDDEPQLDRQDPVYRRWRAKYDEMVGEHDSMLQVFRYIDRVAPGDTTVLLSGESGTGKELAAEAIHHHSGRADGPFLKVNCAAFVEELLLSELFGHKEGAFTGAVSDRAGRFERADGGTIFLDEIGDISPKTQVALLRVLQEGTFEPVGGMETKSVDVRVVAATNRDLEAMVQQGEFRLDLYYRLKGFVIEMPTLRERRDDIPRLLQHFAARYSPNESAATFSPEVVQFLSRYRWPGNVRELENFVQSVLLFVEDDQVEMEHILQFREFFSDSDIDESLPDIDVEFGPLQVDPELLDAENLPTVEHENSEEALVEDVVENERSLSKLKKRLEHKCIKRALRQTGGNITQAARILQMKRPRLSQIVNGNEDLLALKQELVG